MAKGPGRNHRKGISLIELAERFPTEEAAVKWFEDVVWPGERACGKCGSTRTVESSHAKMPYWCSDCRSYFSVRTGTVMERSKVPVRKWVYAIYLDVTSLKGVAAMKLHRDIGVSYKTAWFMQQRIREAFAAEGPVVMSGPVEVDETYMGGKSGNKHASERTGRRGPQDGKTAVAGAKDRETGQVAARVVERMDGETLNSFVDAHADPGAKVYTDGSTAYKGRENHESVAHSAGEYVRYLRDEKIHTNGVESFWSMLKRAHTGTFHRLSPKHLHRYVNEFCGRHNIRDLDTIRQMEHVVARMVGKRLMYRDLVADDGRSAAAS